MRMLSPLSMLPRRRDILLSAAGGLVAGIMAQGCGEANAGTLTPVHPDFVSFVDEQLPSGPTLRVCPILRVSFPALYEQIVSRVLSVQCNGVRIGTGWIVHVLQSGSFPTDKGLYAMGCVDAPHRTIYVSLAVRSGETDPARLVPALEHEWGHVVDPYGTDHRLDLDGMTGEVEP